MCDFEISSRVCPLQLKSIEFFRLNGAFAERLNFDDLDIKTPRPEIVTIRPKCDDLPPKTANCDDLDIRNLGGGVDRHNPPSTPLYRHISSEM